jgi:lysophospholipase L1-like esterase
MISRYRVLLGCCLSASVLVPSVAPAQPAAPAAPATAQKPQTPPKKEAADVGAIKGNPDDPNNGFLKRHEGFLKDLQATNGNVGVLFVGDSITDGWRGGGKQVFAKNYGEMHPLNIGIGGDRTQHVIWRLEHGEVEGISPKVAMLMIGTNNLNSNTNEEIAAGVTKIVHILREKLPQTKVLLLGIFPRGAKAEDPARARIKAINAEIAKLDDGGKTVKYLDIGEKFLEPDGTLAKEIMPDALHPNEMGYQVWAAATAHTLGQMMKDAPDATKATDAPKAP